MKYSNITRLFTLLMLGCVAFVAGSQVRYYQKMAMYIAAESVEAINPPQERAAAKLFKDKFAEFGEILTPSQIDKIKYPDYDCLWINVDSIGKSQGSEKFRAAFMSKRFRDTVKQFYLDGGNLYMSKFAIELLFSDGIGVLPDYIRPNVFESGAGSMNADIWSINAEIGARYKDDADKSRYIDRRQHPIYADLVAMYSNDWAADPDPIYNEHLYQVFPMQGTPDKASIHREDHGCMWRVAMKTDENATVAIYTGYEVHSFADINKVDNPQERAALDYLLNPEGYFHKIRPNVKVDVICPEHIEKIDPNNYDCVWIHIDRCGLEKGWENLPEAYRKPELIEALKKYTQNGGQLLLSKQATQLVVPIGRVDARFAPNNFNSGNGGEGNDDWEVNALIGYDWRDSNPSLFFDRTGYKIYEGMTATQRNGHDVYPLLGTANSATSLWREDHNCLWNLNAIYSGVEGNRVVMFQNDVNARVLGTWGHVADDAVAGIVEFRPTVQYRGRIIANGMSAYELAPRNGGNAWTDNMNLFTFNCLRYLVTVTDFSFVNDGVDGVERFEKDADATVLGTWGQDWNHQAAGIVEFNPRSSVANNYALLETTSPELEKLNANKAKPGTIVANGLGCVQLYHAANDNYYQSNANRLTTNIIDYLSPWHEAVLSGVEDVAGGEAGRVYASEGEICWSGFDTPATLEVYSVDGRLVKSLTISGEGSVDCGLHGPAIVAANGTVTKLILR